MDRKELFYVDFLQGPIARSLLIFSIPILISNIFQQFYNMADTMIVGHFLGDQALAAIGAASVLYDLLVGFALGIGNGLAVVTARCFGSGDMRYLKKSVASSLCIGLVSSLLITVIGGLSLKPVLELLNTPAEILEEAYSYVSVIIWFTIVMFAYNLCAAMLRAIGNSIMPLVFLVFSSVVNVMLDVLFISEFSMGVRGAAVATVIAQGISVVLCLIYIWKRAKILLPEKEHFVCEKDLYAELIGQGLSMGLMGSIVSSGTVILQYGINGFGTLIIAGHTAARKIQAFLGMLFGTTATAIATFSSQNRGAGQRERIIKANQYMYVYDLIACVVISVLLIFAAEPMVRMVSGSEESVVIENAVMYLRVASPFYGILGVLVQTRCALQGLGEKLIPLISSVIEFFGKILFVVLLIPKFEYMAVIFCEPVIWCIMTVQLVYAFYTNPFIRGRKN